MTHQPFARLAFAGAIALGLLATGCGQQTPYGGAYDPYNTGYGSDPYGSSTGYGSGYGSDPYSGGYSSSPTGGYGSDPYGSGYGSSTGYGTGGTTAGGTYGGYPVGGGFGQQPPGVVQAQLVVGQLKKESKGFLFWKKLVVSAQVSNPTTSVLSGEISINFMKSGKVVETQTEFVTDLAQNQAHSFTCTSKKMADDVTISVSSAPGQAAPGGYGAGAGYGGGTGYGSGTGYGAGTGYGSGYGSGTGSSYPY